jgi:hypothetical protein
MLSNVSFLCEEEYVVTKPIYKKKLNQRKKDFMDPYPKHALNRERGRVLVGRAILLVRAKNK